MIYIYYSNTDAESFKKKFYEVVEISDGLFHSYNSPLTGDMHGNSFEVRRGYRGSGDVSVFAPVVNGIVHSRGQRTMVSLTPRLGTLGVGMTVVLILIGIGICVSSLLSDAPDSTVRGLAAGILVPTGFFLLGLYYYSSRSKELIRDFADKLDLERE
jgi:hypothetical protein